MARQYGVPYQGSKNGIADGVLGQLPKAKHFVDLFAGGCAITHRALLLRGYEFYHANDISDAPQLFLDAVNGKFRKERRWISREDFARLKDSEPYVRYCWSFGNNGGNYLYSKEIEPYKRAFHYAVVYADDRPFEEFGVSLPRIKASSIYERKLELGTWLKKNSDHIKKQYIAWYSKKYHDNPDVTAERIDTERKLEKEEERLRNYLLDALAKSGLTQAEVGRRLGAQMQGHYFGKSQWAFPTYEEYTKMQQFMPLPMHYDEVTNYRELLQSLQSLQRLQRLQRQQRLQSLESLESLQRLQSLERLTVTQGDYRDVEIPEDAVVYCDIPYKGTAGYNKGTEHETFDHEAFYEWALSRPFNVYISEYSMPDDFTMIKCWTKASLMSGTGVSQKKTERLYCTKPELHEAMMNK